MTGLKGIVLAASLAITGLGAGSGLAATPAPAASPAAAAPAAAAAAPIDPMLVRDGAPELAPTVGIGQPGPHNEITIQPQVTANGRYAEWFHDWILFPLIVAISIFVLILLAWVVIRYRKAANPVPSKTSHHVGLEVAWTLVPVLILVAIALPSIGLLQAQFKPAPANAVTLKAIGNQWYWSYQYPDNGGFEITSNMLKDKNDPNFAKGDRARVDADGPRLLATDNRVVLPVGVPIRLITTSNDVIHSWAIPAFWIKLDAVPGRLNETSFTIEKEGLYFGVCSELCGARHGYMPITVQAVSPAVFAQWVKAKGGTMPAPKSASQPAPALVETGDPQAVANAMGPVDNAAEEAAPTTNQGATANPGASITGK
ncbi:cytochrome c oxidase subunit II [Sphingomonas immobilis]|uniref:Cytochrome c oxidase subunit 2 n=1 Tax=Sphingomonas immobilis TaxID=3063997 RepID=A0ABT9A2C1_9SPHN|nr:cytochrome c oxidase subunit II [Sphingomonas sp. CA1-15]MDO7843983.1 cytochrome c oxidase subunit II [Sphingomonas sp. CA1-15]